MATRMQQRRGTAAQWISTNSGNGPILAAGEIGFESDTNKFKVGDGVNHWVDLTYFTDADSITTALNSIIDGAPAALNTLNELAAALGDDPNFLASLATETYVDTAINNAAFDSAAAAGVGLDWNAGTEQFDIDNTVVTTGGATIVGTLNFTDGTVTDFSVTDTLGTQDLNVDGNAIILGTLDVTGDTVIDGSLTVNGQDFAASATSIVIEDNLVQLAHQNSANTVDLGLVVAYNDGAAKHSGVVRDVSANKWKIFKGVTTEPTTTVDFTQGSLDDLEVAGLTANSVTASTLTVGSVSNTEIGYLDGVTSAIQTQIDSKASTSDLNSHASDTTNIHGITDTAELATKTYVDGAVSGHEADQLNVHGIADTSQLATLSDLSSHSSDTTSVHGIADTTELATKTYADSAVSTHSSDTTSVHGIADTAELATKTYADGKASDAQTYADSAVSTHNSDTTSVHGIADTSVLATDSDVSAAQSAAESFATSAVSTHSSDTTNVHGITDTSKLVKTDAVSTTLDGALIVSGDFTVNGTNFSASATSITIEDNLVQLAHQNAGNTVDLGLVVAYNDGAAKHSGIVRDVSADKWKLFKGVTTEPSTTVDFTQGSLDALQVAALEATTVTPSSGVVFSDGTQTKEGVASRTPIIQKTASYTLSALTERDSLIEVSSASGTTITIPTNSAVAYPVGTSIDVLQTSTGQVTIAGDTGVTVNATPGLKLRAQWSSATLFKRAENTWVVMGDLSA